MESTSNLPYFRACGSAWFVLSKVQHFLDMKKKWPSNHLFWNADSLVERESILVKPFFWNKKYKKAIDDSKKNVVEERNISEKAEQYIQSDPWLSLDDNSIEWLKNLSKSDENNGLIIKWFFNPPKAPLISDAKRIFLMIGLKVSSKSSRGIRQILINDFNEFLVEESDQTVKENLQELKNNSEYISQNDFEIWKKSRPHPTDFLRPLRY